MLDELLHGVERHAVVPARVGQLVGPAHAREPLLQVVEGGLRHVDAERAERGVVHPGNARRHRGTVRSSLCGTLDAMLETSARLLQLLSLLQARPHWTGR